MYRIKLKHRYTTLATMSPKIHIIEFKSEIIHKRNSKSRKSIQIEIE
jgi:hypothetical protein